MKATKKRAFSRKERIARMDKCRAWVRANPKLSYLDFSKEMGGTKSQFYHARRQSGLATPVPELQKPRARPQVVQPPKDEVVVEGNSPDFIWYEMELITNKLEHLRYRIEHVSKVARARDGEQKDLMQRLMDENAELTRALRKANGAPV
jgi:hypothetical protein